MSTPIQLRAEIGFVKDSSNMASSTPPSTFPFRILIFGATGTIGRYITDALLNAQPSFDQVSIFTSPGTVESKVELLEPWKDKGLQVVTGDITNPNDIAAAYESEKPDTVVSCLGRGAIQHQTEIIRLAEEGTVKWLFPSEYGTDIEYGPKSVYEKPHQNKLAVRQYIRENIKRLKVTYLVTGPYFDMWVRRTPVEGLNFFDAEKKEAVLVEDGKGKIGFCTMAE